MASVDHMLIVGSAGTNKVMEAELSRLSRRALSRLPPRPARAGTGTLVYPFDAELAALALAYHRTCTRVLRELYTVDATRLEPLFDQLVAEVAADERDWLADGATISVRARNVDSFEAGTRQVVGTVKNALIEGAARRGLTVAVDPDAPDLLITARMHSGAMSISIDLGGRSLSKRGYRREAGEAPLREHLAAVLLMLARWDARSEALVDPMCGSGTIAIEAALMAQARPRAGAPGEPLFADAAPEILASDRDRGVIDIARRNARAAGVEDRVAIEARDLFDLGRADLPPRGLILANPPYGERLEVRELSRFYADLGDWCRSLRTYRVGLLVADGPFAQAFGARARVTKPLANGSIRAHFYLYEP